MSKLTGGAAKLVQLEDVLYGTDETDARLPLPNEIATILGVTFDD
jgi:hypothetical protein